MANDITTDSSQSDNVVDAIRESHARLLDGLRELAVPDDVIAKASDNISRDGVLKAAIIRIKKLMPVALHAFLLADENFDFPIYACSPVAEKGNLQKILDDWIEEGIFSWALNQNRAVILNSDHKQQHHVLHVLATRSRVLGMFIARVEADALLDEGVLTLLSAVLMNCAHGLESQELQQQLKTHNDNLEVLIHDRTRQLEIAKNRAEKSVVEKSAFLATMSHEIRTPMNGVIGMAQLLLQSQLTQEQRKITQTIVQSGRALVHLINDILDFSKIEAGKLVLDETPFDIVQLFEEVVQLFTLQAKDKGLKLELVCEKSLHRFVNGDAGRIRQILTNFVGNAIKFTASGFVKIQVETQGDIKTRRFKIAVIDSGIGIKPEDQAKLFHPFAQSDASIARTHGGTGLGLAICKQLVALMNGDIGLSSRYGEGSTFWIDVELPLTDSINTQTITPRTRASNSHEGAEHHRFQGKVLVVEDNEVNQEVIQLMLKSLGLQFKVANHGYEALDLLEKSTFDLILMDCQMPKLNGYETTKAIRDRHDREYQRIPVIALTANALESDRDLCFASGMDDFISKPIELNQLIKILAKWLEVELDATSLTIQEPEGATSMHTPIVEENDLLDEQAMDQLLKLMKNKFVPIRDSFINNTTNKLEILRTALANANVEEAQRILHSLKGSCATLAAKKLASIITQLDAEAKKGNLEIIIQTMPELEKCFSDTAKKMRTLTLPVEA